MTGRRLLDVAAIFTATRKVASKHTALRSRQLDVFSKTSSLARAVKSQTDRVTLTIKAGTALADRFNSPNIHYSSQNPQDNPPKERSDVDHSDLKSVNDLSERPSSKQGHTQDYSYKELNEIGAASHERDLSIKQNAVNGSSQPGEPFPTRNAPISPNQHEDVAPTVSKSPEVKPTTKRASNSTADSAIAQVKTPKNSECVRSTKEPVSNNEVNQDVFYSPASEDKQQIMPEQEQLSEEAYSEIFHSPRVAKLLKAQPRKKKFSNELELPGAESTPVKDSKAPQETDQVSSGVRMPAQDETNSQEISDLDTKSISSEKDGDNSVHALAKDMANDADRVTPNTSKVQ